MTNEEKLLKQMEKRIKESYDRKDSFGMFGSYFKDPNTPLWRAKEGEHLLDLVPSPVGAFNPHVKKGDSAYVLDVWIHFDVGVNDDHFVCLKSTFGKACPICEHQKQMKSEEGYNEAEAKALYPKRRCIYNIICYDTEKEEDKGIQVWEVAHFFMEKHLTTLAKDPRSGETIPFAMYNEMGKSISFTRSGSGAKNTSYIGHRFVDRDYSIPKELRNEAFCLDELIKVPTYDEVYESFWGQTVSKEEDKEEKTEKKTGRKRLRQPLNESTKETEEKSSAENADICPHEGTFGITIDELEKCDSCDIYNDCMQKATELMENDND